jgi:hypothetical protein
MSLSNGANASGALDRVVELPAPVTDADRSQIVGKSTGRRRMRLE